MQGCQGGRGPARHPAAAVDRGEGCAIKLAICTALASALAFAVEASLSLSGIPAYALVGLLALAVVLVGLAVRVVARHRGGPARPAYVAGTAPGLVVLSIAGVAFVLILDGVLSGSGVAALDRPVLRFLAARRDSGATTVLRLVTYLGGTPFVVLITVALAMWWWRRYRRAALLLSAAVFGSGAITAAVKLLVARDRPARPLAIDGAESGFSFPSGHSLSAMALYGTLAYLVVTSDRSRSRRTCLAAALISTAVAVAFSRLYLGYHWLSDVLGSWALAALWLAAVVTFDRLHRQRRLARPFVGQSGEGHVRPSAALGVSRVPGETRTGMDEGPGDTSRIWQVPSPGATISTT